MSYYAWILSQMIHQEKLWILTKPNKVISNKLILGSSVEPTHVFSTNLGWCKNAHTTSYYQTQVKC